MGRRAGGNDSLRVEYATNAVKGVERMQKPGPIAARAASDALLNVGVHEEGGNNHGRYVKVYLDAVGLGEGEPWCAAFVYYRLARAAQCLLGAGKPVPLGYPQSGYTPDIEAWGRKRGLWTPVQDAIKDRSRVQRGDLALFYFRSQGRIAHVGIVTGVVPTGTYTVEGNTGPGNAIGGVVREGDGVYQKFRHWEELGLRGGFVRLPF